MRLLRWLLNAFNPVGRGDAFQTGLACVRLLVVAKIVYGLVMLAGRWVFEPGDPVGHWIGRGASVPFFSLSLLVFLLLPLPWRYLVKRLLLMALTLWAATFVAFFVIQAAPGDFTSQYLLNPQFSEEALQEMVRKYGFDRPVIEQYARWLWRVVAYQDFGVSTKYTDVPVFKVLRTRMLATFQLSAVALVLIWAFSVPIGVYSAIKQYSIGDKVLSVLAFIGMSLPTFFVAFLLLYFATTLKIIGHVHRLVIPVAVLTISSLAGMMRLMRGNMLEVKRAQYVTTARAKGLSERTVIYKHMLRNAVNPMVTIFGYQLSGLLSGAALTEAVLNYPGLGRLILDAVLAQDLYLVMASMVMGTSLLLIGNLIADLMLVVVDPRIQVQ